MSKYSIVQTEAEWEFLSPTEAAARLGHCLRCGGADQLPEGWVWMVDRAAPRCAWPSSVLWSAVAGAEAAGVMEEELTPLEVLTELCWMASFWGLPGTDISSQLSSFSDAANTHTHSKKKGPLRLYGSIITRFIQYIIAAKVLVKVDDSLQQNAAYIHCTMILFQNRIRSNLCWPIYLGTNMYILGHFVNTTYCFFCS